MITAGETISNTMSVICLIPRFVTSPTLSQIYPTAISRNMTMTCVATFEANSTSKTPLAEAFVLTLFYLAAPTLLYKIYHTTCTENRQLSETTEFFKTIRKMKRTDQFFKGSPYCFVLFGKNRFTARDYQASFPDFSPRSPGKMNVSPISAVTHFPPILMFHLFFRPAFHVIRFYEA